jgi:glycosyltransferase involved in cell wall biosynthesis
MSFSFTQDEHAQNNIEKSDTPKISVVIPVYNIPEKYLRKCLESVINQTLAEIEIILINDGSTNDSLKILEEYAQRDSRIILINKKNEGVSVARNIGLEIARGEYIGFVDADDWIDKNFYEVLYKTAKRENADIVMTYFDMFYISKQSIIMDGCLWCHIWNKVFRRKILEMGDIRFPKNYPAAEDEQFYRFARYFQNKTVFVKCNNVGMYYYRQQRQNSLTATPQKNKNIFHILAVADFIDFLNAQDNLSKERYIYNFNMMFLNMSFVLFYMEQQEQYNFFCELSAQFKRCKYIRTFNDILQEPVFKALLNSNFDAYIEALKDSSFEVFANKYLNAPSHNSLYDYNFLTARKVFEILKKYLTVFRSVVDINCKNLAWLNAFKESGFEVGNDDPVLYTLNADFVRKENIKLCNIDDLSNEHFDLVIRLPEYFELEELEIKKHIHLLCEISDVIIFGSDAPLYIEQAEQREPSYYNYLFRQEGFVCFDIFRNSLWNAPYASWPIKQNLVLYIKENKAQELIKQGLKEIEYLPTKYCLDYVNLLKEKSFEKTQDLNKKLKKYRKCYQIFAIGFFIILIMAIILIVNFIK